MKKRTLSRRKFLTRMGIATVGTAVLAPVVKLTGKRSLVKAWSQPQSQFDKNDHFFVNTKVRNREAGSHLLPLDQRPI